MTPALVSRKALPHSSPCDKDKVNGQVLAFGFTLRSRTSPGPLAANDPTLGLSPPGSPCICPCPSCQVSWSHAAFLGSVRSWTHLSQQEPRNASSPGLAQEPRRAGRGAQAAARAAKELELLSRAS